MKPTVLQLPPDPVIITSNIGSIQQANGSPLFWKFEVTTGTGLFGLLGQNCTFDISSLSPCNLGIYGPNPTQIGPPFGRMRSPKINFPDAMHHRCQGNFKPGTYYLVVRQGNNAPPVDSVKIMITTQGWQVFG